MALGKNMKIDRLIPLSEDFDNDNGVGNSEKEDQPVSISLDDFFGESSPELDPQTQSEPQSEPQPQPEPQPQSQPQSEPQPQSRPQYEDIDTESLKIKFIPSRRKTQKRILIDIEGDLTIKNVEILYSKVNEVFTNFDNVEVTLKNITAIDLSVIQLFHAIRVSYYSQQKFIEINAEFNREDRKMLNACGFTEFQTQKTAS